jgi:SAM-dependent methyltransferase
VIPGLGFQNTLIATALLNLLAAGLAAFATRPHAMPVLATAAACALSLLVVRPSAPWNLISASTLAFDISHWGKGSPVAPETVLFMGVGRSSTVLLFEEGSAFRLRNNGLPEASIERPGAVPRNSLTARWMSILPAFAPAAPRELLVIGLGGGVVLEDVPNAFERIDVVELEPEVLEANRQVAKLRDKDPLADPRVRVLLNDARGALMLSDLRYGAIVSQPSHPWTAGSSHLYTRDFFEQVRGHLAPGGVFVQWMGLQFVDESLLRSLLATLLSVFPHVRVYQADPGSMLFVSSPDPFDLESRAEAVMALDPETFARAGLRVREDLAASLTLDEEGARALAEGHPLATDDKNRFATHSPRVLGRAIGNVDRLVGPHDPLVGELDHLDALYLVRHLVRTERIPRAQRIARSIQNPLERTLAELEIALARREPRKASRLLVSALALDPSSEWARYRALPEAGDDGAGAHPMSEARRLHAARDWQGLARLDGVLAGFDVRHPAHPDAQQLRIDWRIGTGRAEASAEAVALIDVLPFGGPEQLARRALAGLQGAQPGVAQQSLEQLAGQLKGQRAVPLSSLAAEWAVTAMDALPDAELSKQVHALRPSLVRMRNRGSRPTADLF